MCTRPPFFLWLIITEQCWPGVLKQGQPIKYFLEEVQRIPFSPDTSAGASRHPTQVIFRQG